MGEISVGEAVSAGFGLISRRPLTVVVWGVVQTALAVATFAALAPAMVAMFAQVAQATAAGQAASPSDSAAMMKSVGAMQGLSSLLNLIQIFVSAVVYCAVFRSVIHPEQSRFAYLRVGGTELMLAMLSIGAGIAIVIGVVVAAIPAAVIIAILAATHAAAAAVVVGVVFAAILVAGVIYIFLRLSMLGPIMVDLGKIEFGDAWRLTKGKVGTLFLIALCLFGILIGLEILVTGIGGTIGFLALSNIAGGWEAIPALLKQPPAAILARLSPLLLAAVALATPIYGALLAIIAAPWAKAYLNLRQSPAEVFS